MQLGILGLPKAGKTTLFNTLTAAHEATDKFTASRKTHVGVAQVSDTRLDELTVLFKPRKRTPATIEYVDIPGIKKGDGPESLDLGKLRTVDALVHVVRAFEDPEILHAEGDVDIARDILTVELELILADYEVAKRRIGRLEEATKRGLSDDEKREQRLLTEVVLKTLEAETPLRELEFSDDDDRRLRGFQFLSAKPLLVALNVDESTVAHPPQSFGVELRKGVEMLVVSARIEEEISRLESQEQQLFLADLDLEDSSLKRLIRKSYQAVGLLSFFTVGEDEVKAWTVHRGCRARKAAGAIHSDLEKGFIRAEVVAWQELLRCQSLAACRSQGVLRLEGKDYEVQDGDVIQVRFNV